VANDETIYEVTGDLDSWCCVIMLVEEMKWNLTHSARVSTTHVQMGGQQGGFLMSQWHSFIMRS